MDEKNDGTKESLIDKSKRPVTPHPNSYTIEEIKNINNLLKRNPNISLSELYGKLKKNYAYTRHPTSLFRFLGKNGVYVQSEVKHNKYTPKPYNTPITIGEKMQMDVKHVPSKCFLVKSLRSFTNTQSLIKLLEKGLFMPMNLLIHILLLILLSEQ